MLWRILTVVVVLFWALMTGLLLRDTYYPDNSRFAEVPPKFVLDLFLREAATLNNTLHLYHEKAKIGHGNFNFRKLANDDETAPPVYAVLATGHVQPEAAPDEKGVSWRLNGELVDGARWRSLQLHTKMPQNRLTADIVWKEGDALPQVEVRRGSDVMIDSQTLRAMMALQSGGGGHLSWLAQAGQSGTAKELGGMQLRAREGLMDLAGKQRKCYILYLRLLDAYEVRAYFTEVGELARVDLPEGYQLLEPLMHGLESGTNNVE